MKYKISGGSFPIVEVILDKDKTIISESGAMCWKDPSIEMKTTTDGGIKKVFGRMFTGEKLFHNMYTATEDNSKISFGSCVPGSIKAIELKDGQSIICQKHSFLFAMGDIELSVYLNKKIGAGLFGGEGFILEKIEGNGIVFLEIDGTEVEYELNGNDQIEISTGHLVSMSESCNIDIKMIKGAKNIFFGGEGLFNTTITGPGKVVLQTMPLQKLANAISPYIEVKTSSSNNITTLSNNKS